MSVDAAFLRRLAIEPLDRQRHDRSGFACGVAQIDGYLREQAAKLADIDYARVYVACEPGGSEIFGFFALAPHAIDISALPAETARKLPRFPTVPAIYLSMVAVSSARQGKGLGTYLMAEALAKCRAVADLTGGHFVALDALNADAARLYRRLGFVPLASAPSRMLLAMATLRRSMAKR